MVDKTSSIFQGHRVSLMSIDESKWVDVNQFVFMEPAEDCRRRCYCPRHSFIQLIWKHASGQKGRGT
jgi:hypothetical protein